MTTKTKQRIKWWAKTISGAILGIPSVVAVIELLVFGPSWNNVILTPLLRPFVNCQNERLPGNDGGYLLYETTATVGRPILLFVPWRRLSMNYQLNLEGDMGFTFYGIGDLSKSDGLVFIEHRTSSEPHIAKSLHFSHRFMSAPTYSFKVKVSGPTPLSEDECPFVYSARY